MKTTVFIIFFCISSFIHACPEIEGNWKSSAELSHEFNSSSAQLTKGIQELNSQIYGNSILTMKEGIISLKSSIKEVTIDGETHDWDGSYKGKYEVLGCTESSIALKIKVENLEYINVIQFNNNNTMWLYNGYLFDTQNGHSREYFIRQ